MSKYFDKLFVLELANNTNGDVNVGFEIVRQASKICEPYKQYGFQFAIKLQYRNLDSLIHPDFKDSDLKYIKRFRDTRLSWDEFKQIKDYAKEKGFITACTPFDEVALQKVIEHDFDIIKIASCSFTDWPLLEEIVKHDKPIIASCGAIELEDIDNVVSFMQHRNKEFALLHCVPEYPTKEENNQLDKIDLLKNRYPNIRVGFSSHEKSYPDRITEYALLKNTDIIERHVKYENIGGNEYSLSLKSLSDSLICDRLKEMLDAALRIYKIKEIKEIHQSQKDTIRSLQRGVYAKKDIAHGELLTKDNIYFAMPCQDWQLSANDITKYKEYTVVRDTYDNNKFMLKKDAPITLKNISSINKRQQVLDIVKKLIPIIKESGIVIPDRCEMELSHHYGLDKFKAYGAAIFNVINKEYCKKYIILLDDQENPAHWHAKKKETFICLHGILTVCYSSDETEPDKEFVELKKGETYTIKPYQSHVLYSAGGCIAEEISTTHIAGDSYYSDDNVLENRKTRLTFRSEWLTKGVK